MTAAIELKGVTKVFGAGAEAVHALRGIELSVAPGEVLYLTGPSGSGKTTLVSIIGCVLSASTGSVKLFGREVTTMKEAALAQLRLETIGFVFQGHNLIASLTSLENVRLPLLLRGVPVDDAEDAAREALARVGLADKQARRPAELSGGQKQRVAVARAIVAHPRLVLADEPTASLDAKTGHEVMHILTQLARAQGTTVAVVTHDNRIIEFADRVIAIEDGRLVPPQEKAA
jgi:putative ABC transport system ATP-binding protein